MPEGQQLSNERFVFCPNCHAYLEPDALECSQRCGFQRSSHELPVKPGQELWKTSAVNGGVMASPVVCGDCLIYTWGDRVSSGGVVAVHRQMGDEIWRVETGSIDSSATVAGGRVYFATRNLIPGGDRLHCVRLETGEDVCRPVNLTAGVWSAPQLKQEVCLYVGLADGQVLCFDSRRLELISRNSSRLGKKILWLASSGEMLFALSEDGKVWKTKKQYNGALAWSELADLKTSVACAPAVGNEYLYCGTMDGRLLALRLRDARQSTLLSDLIKITGTPAIREGMLFVGGQNHCLHAVDLKSEQEVWHQNCFRSISSTPAVCEGVVITGTNDGVLYAFDVHSSELLWRHGEKVEPHRLLSGITSHEDTCYCGDEKGVMHALPWHLGRYSAAAKWFSDQKREIEAGHMYALAACFERDINLRNELREKAVACWEAGHQPEWSARLFEGLGDLERAAEAYVHAAQVQDDRQKAAMFFYRASRLFWRLDRLDEMAKWAIEAARRGRWPLLRLKGRNLPRLKQMEQGMIGIRIENIGETAARDITIHLGGSIMGVQTIQIVEALAPGLYYDLTFSIVPTRPDNTLTVEAEYRNVAGDIRPFQSNLPDTVLEASAPPDVIEIEDVVNGVVEIKSNDNRPVRLKIGTTVNSKIQIKTG